ncbi:MAG: hypothetical protein Q9222_005515 [Ikaeria aurantiellina]
MVEPDPFTCEVPWNSPMIEPFGDLARHGTEVAAKMVGRIAGVAKAANLKTVRFPLTPSLGSSTTMASTLKGLYHIYRDVEENDLEGRSIINISWGGPGPLSYINLDYLKETFQRLIHEGTVIVVAGGDKATESGSMEINTYPALIVREIPELIVVGSVDAYGQSTPGSQGVDPNLLTISAQGTDTRVDAGGPHNAMFSGIAAATISGLAAYLMSLDRFYDRLSAGSEVTDPNQVPRRTTTPHGA